MKALLLSEIFPPKTGGSGRWFWEIYRRLPRDQYALAVGEHPRQAEFDRSHDLNLARLPLALPSWGLCSFRGATGYWRALARVGQVAQREKVEMIHCGRSLPEGLMALALWWRRGIPYLCYAHGEELEYASSSRELGWLLRRVLGGARCVIANSKNTRSILTRDWGMPSERMRLLYPGVETNRFVPAGRDPRVRAELGWGDRPVVLTVGRLQKRKGHDQLIAALPRIRECVPDVLYAIVGDGEEREHLQTLAAQFGVASSVRFMGEMCDDSLIRCYQQCDLFVLPNRQVGKDIEGFGMVLLEAQACGKPVVAGASGGTAETMQVGETGYVIPCEHPHDLAETLKGLLSAPEQRARMGSAGRQWVAHNFEWSRLSEKAVDIFEEAARVEAPRSSCTTAELCAAHELR
ncbi:MAG: glycosyltransferase family 4 protein [Gemmataceae bacterium]|nr:glycosyltransferase family 4 protein [Gemmataceae bacterium]MCI0743389.1 glycosyltransferase family 4 protein [Gemmataceae bacterium]